MKSSSKLFMRWSTHIFSFNFKILHRKGKIHLNTDILSREKSVLDEPTKQDHAEANIHSIFPVSEICTLTRCQICNIQFSHALHVQKFDMKHFHNFKTVPLTKINALTHINESIVYPFTNQNLSSAQKNDRILSEVGLWIIQGGPDNIQHFDEELLYYTELFDRLYLKDDIIYLQLQDDNDFETIFGYPSKILIPLSLRHEVITSAHSSKQSGHFKLQTTLYRISSKYHWKTMKHDISVFIKQCVQCNVSQDVKP